MRKIISNKLFVEILRLSVKVLIILIYNLYLRKELCNGTEILITRINQFYIEAKIFNKIKYEKLRLIPRILITFNNDNLPFILK